MLHREVRIGRNEPCWCGSGLKYKKCHLNRAFEQPTPLGQLRDLLRKSFRQKLCLHPNAAPNVCGQVVQAHTIQRSGAIAEIRGNDNHVLSFDPHSGTGLEPHKVGWKEASTFRGFCSVHDEQLFAPLEKQPFAGSIQQCFLIAYRALCHELYQKQAALGWRATTKQMVDRGLNPTHQAFAQMTLMAHEDGLRAGVRNLTALKERCDHAVLNSDFTGWGRCVVYFDGTMSVASTGCPNPHFDIEGCQLQTLQDLDSSAEHLFLGVVKTDTGGAIIFSWPQHLGAAARAWLKSLVEKDQRQIPSLIVEFIFAYIENTFFSESWWVALSESCKQRIFELAMMPTPYRDSWSYSNLRLVDWQVTNIESDGL